MILDRASVFTVRLTRPGHPFEGCELRVLGRMRRHGALELILELPDGSKSMMPAAWTDHAEPAADGESLPAEEPTLGRITDLLDLTWIVSSLLPRVVSEVVEADINEQVEGCPRQEAPDADPAAVEPAAAAPPADRAARGGARRGGAAAGRGGRGGGRPARPADRGGSQDDALFDAGELR
jgi:hypothetical protein